MIYDKMMKNFLNKVNSFVKFLCQHKIIYFAFSAFVVFVVYLCIRKEDNKNLLLEIIVASIFGGIVLILLNIITERLSSFLMQKFEDIEKLGDEEYYKSLINLYHRSNLVVSENVFEQGKNNRLPAICDVFFPYGSQVKIIIKDSQSFYQLPVLVANSSSKILNYHRASFIKNNINVRVDKIDIKSKDDIIELTLYTSRTKYLDSILTNRSMNCFLIKDAYFKVSIRDMYEPGPYLSRLEESSLSNHLGFNGMIETRDGLIFIDKRAGNLSIGKGKTGCSVEAAMKSKFALDDKTCNFTVKGLMNSIYQEIGQELGYKLNNEEKQKLKIIAFYRDLVEGGKPQFCFYLKLDVTFYEFKKNYLRKNNNNKNQNNYVLRDGKKIICICRDAFINSTIKEDCIYFNRDSSRLYKMMPSSLTTCVLVRKYLKSQIYN